MKRFGSWCLTDKPFLYQNNSEACEELVSRNQSEELLANANHRAEKAEAKVVKLREALENLLDPFRNDECYHDHHGYCQAHFLEVDCCVASARAVIQETADGGDRD